jgi:hypothetical protein
VILATAILFAGVQTSEAKAAAKLGEELVQVMMKEGAKPSKTYILFSQPKRVWKVSTKPDEQLGEEGGWREDVEAVGTVWPKAKVGTYVSISYSSPSGDWFAAENYAIRSNGAFAMAKTYFSSFNPIEFRRIEVRLFSKTGKLLSTKIDYTNFDEKPLTKAELKTVGDIGKEFKLLSSAKKIPFAIK